MEEWEKIPTSVLELPLYKVLKIFDDAQGMGFEIKVENGKFLTREV